MQSPSTLQQLKRLLRQIRPTSMRNHHERVAEQVRARIREWVLHHTREVWEPSKKPVDPVTIATQPNGFLRSLYDPTSPYHITHVDADGFCIGTTHPIVPFVKHGTRPHEIRPKDARALRFIRADGEVVYTARVMHPGTPPRVLYPPQLRQEIAHILVRSLQTHLVKQEVSSEP